MYYSKHEPDRAAGRITLPVHREGVEDSQDQQENWETKARRPGRGIPDFSVTTFLGWQIVCEGVFLVG